MKYIFYEFSPKCIYKFKYYKLLDSYYIDSTKNFTFSQYYPKLLLCKINVKCYKLLLASYFKPYLKNLIFPYFLLNYNYLNKVK